MPANPLLARRRCSTPSSSRSRGRSGPVVRVGLFCSGVAPSSRPGGSPGRTAGAALQLQSLGDPQTPYRPSLEHRRLMGGRLLITVDGGDHGQFGRANPVIDAAVVEYLRTGRTAVTTAPQAPNHVRRCVMARSPSTSGRTSPVRGATSESDGSRRGWRSSDGRDDVVVTYHSFELAPDTPVDFDGSEVDFLVQHKGIHGGTGTADARQMTRPVRRTAVRYDFAALRHTNTVRPTRCCTSRKSMGVQRELADRLFAAYFTEGRHLGRDGRTRRSRCRGGARPRRGADRARGGHLRRRGDRRHRSSPSVRDLRCPVLRPRRSVRDLRRAVVGDLHLRAETGP